MSDPDSGPRMCRTDLDCDDDLFCDGVERCDPSAPSADAQGCLPSSGPPCASGERCREDTDECAPIACPEPDLDADGFGAIDCGGDDCDDSDPLRHPGATEVCDGADRDEDCNPTTHGHLDLDGDGFDDADCCNGVGTADQVCGEDCDDSERSINPDVPDPCNTIDDDCDGNVDEGGTLYRDVDGDGRGDPAVSMTGGCMVGWVFNAEDCDDLRSETYVGAREICDGRDNDCSLPGSTAGGPDPSEDADGDGHSALAATCMGRGGPGVPAFALPQDDCDDADAGTHPGAFDVCANGVDDNCDAVVDNLEQTICDDADGDAHGREGSARLFTGCTLPAATVAAASAAACDDCNDIRAAIHAGAVELCDRLDNDCSDGGGPDTDEDSDLDGYAPVGATCAGRGEAGVPATALPRTDCDDTAVGVHPGADEICDGLDFDCSSGGASATDEDRDGDGHAAPGNPCLARGEPGAPGSAFLEDDCDDARADVHGGIVASADYAACDGVDLDCDPTTSELTRTDGCAATGGYCGPGATCVRRDQVLEAALGYGFGCARLADGRVFCWGVNDVGQLGDGVVSANRYAPGPVSGITTAIGLAAGWTHACALLRDATVRCWGGNAIGQLGDGSTTDRRTPTPVASLTGVAEIAASEDHTCARLFDGTVWCWGYNRDGVLGSGTAGDWRTSPTRITSLSGVAQLSTGVAHGCAVLADGTARCWGSNYSGELGDPSVVGASVAPVTVAGLSGAVEIAAGQRHTCVRRGDGSLACWGRRYEGQVGDGTTMMLAGVPSPLTLGLSMVAGIDAGWDHSCARLADGGLRCWGENGAGQIGDGTGGTDRGSPVTVALSGVADVEAGPFDTCAVRRDGTLWCWGANGAGEIGLGSPGASELSPRSVPIFETSRDVGAGTSHTCAILRDGSVSCWGNNAHGQLGDGSTMTRTAPTLVPALAGASQLALGRDHTCVMLTDGRVSCWGGNASNQLGDGMPWMDRPTPAIVAGVTGVRAIAAGDLHTCVLRADTTFACWGDNTDGQTGLGTFVDTAGITAGQAHTCAWDVTGALFCRGRNTSGQLGDGTFTSGSTLRAVTLPAPVVDASAGREHTCAVVMGGDVYCWGSNGSRQLGDATPFRRATPGRVPGITGAIAVRAGAEHTCVTRSDGALLCFGSDVAGQLGDGTASSGPGPVTVTLRAAVVDLAVGAQHGCARLADGHVWCWGANALGELGDGSTTFRPSPVMRWEL